jgi:hypothetical protein
LVALGVSLILSGCGDLSRDELNRGVESLSALAAQGELVANGVARDATKSTYARVMAKTLGGEAEHEAEKLADAEPSPEVRKERNAAVQVAGRLRAEGALGGWGLHRHRRDPDRAWFVGEAAARPPTPAREAFAGRA